MKYRVLLIFLLILVINISSASQSPTKYTFNILPAPTFDNNTAFVNASQFWNTLTLGPLDDANPVQFNNIGGTLTIDEAHLALLFCELTGCIMAGDIDMDGSNIINVNNIIIDNNIIFGDSNHFLRLGALGFNGLADNAFSFQHDIEQPEGTVPFIIIANKTNSDNDAVLFMTQVGLNESNSILGNSWIIVVNNLTTNLTKYSKCFLVADMLNETLRVQCDSSESGADLIVQDDIQSFGTMFADGGIRAETLVNFIMNGEDVNIQNGALHIFTPVTFEQGVTAGDEITIFIEDFTGGLGSFTNLQDDLGNWFVTANILCNDGDCANAIGISGIGNIIMEANISTLNVNSTSLNFIYSLSNMIGANDFEVTVNNNVGSGEVIIFTDSTNNVVKSSQSITLPSSMSNQPKVSIRFNCDVTNTNRQCFVDTISVNGTAIETTLTNVSGFNSVIKFSDGALAADGFPERGIIYNASSDTIIIRGNATFENIIEQDLNITNSITLNSTTLFDWGDIPDFFKLDASTPMQGTANFGGFNITNVDSGFLNNLNVTGNTIIGNVLTFFLGGGSIGTIDFTGDIGDMGSITFDADGAIFTFDNQINSPKSQIENLTVSNELKADVIRGLGIPGENITIIPTGNNLNVQWSDDLVVNGDFNDGLDNWSTTGTWTTGDDSGDFWINRTAPQVNNLVTQAIAVAVGGNFLYKVEIDVSADATGPTNVQVSVGSVINTIDTDNVRTNLSFIVRGGGTINLSIIASGAGGQNQRIQVWDIKLFRGIIINTADINVLGKVSFGSLSNVNAVGSGVSLFAGGDSGTGGLTLGTCEADNPGSICAGSGSFADGSRCIAFGQGANCKSQQTIIFGPNVIGLQTQDTTFSTIFGKQFNGTYNEAFIYGANNVQVLLGKDSGVVIFPDGTTEPIIPFEVFTNVSNITARFEANVLAQDFITTTGVFDDSKVAKEYIKISSYYKDENGNIIHNRFGGYKVFEIPDASRPVYINASSTLFNGDIIYFNKTTYPFNTIIEGVSSETETGILRERLAEFGSAMDVAIFENMTSPALTVQHLNVEELTMSSKGYKKKENKTDRDVLKDLRKNHYNEDGTLNYSSYEDLYKKDKIKKYTLDENGVATYFWEDKNVIDIFDYIGKLEFTIAFMRDEMCIENNNKYSWCDF